ncbi:MAG: metalloprotease [Planctomycetota bacterium]
MLLNQPEPTAADLNFSIAGIPVRVHPMFWLMGLLLSGFQMEAPQLIVWMVAVFLGVLVHEMGHALTQRYFGYESWIVLYGLGGLAMQVPLAGRRPRLPIWLETVLISVAGPMAGFALAGLVALAIILAGRSDELFFVGPLNLIPTFSPQPFEVQPALVWFIRSIFFVSVGWGILNLLPVYPLDGGQIARAIMMRVSRHGLRWSLGASLVCCVLLIAWALAAGSIWMAVLFAFLAFQNFQMLQFTQHRGW